MPEMNYKEFFKNHTATIEKCGLLTRIIFQKPNTILHKITYTFMEDQSTLVVTGDCKPLVATNVSNFGKPETLYNSLFNNTYAPKGDIGYFISKITAFSSEIYTYEYSEVRAFLANIIGEHMVSRDYPFGAPDYLGRMMDYFDEDQPHAGIGHSLPILLDPYFHELVQENLDAIPAHIDGSIEMVVYGFKLAYEQLFLSKDKESID